MTASVTIGSMKKSMGEQGEVNVLLVPVILLVVLVVGTGSFGFWAFSSRQNYKNNADALVNAAVTTNTANVEAKDAAQYAQEAKSPLTVYTGPQAYGSVRVSYPKTWSAYIDTTNSSTPLQAYFNDGYVPSTDNSQATYDLQVQINSQSYSTIMGEYTGQIQGGQITAAPYRLPKVPNVVGTRLTGQIDSNNPNVSGVMVVIPLRSTTLEVWTESTSYLSDFDTYILPNLTFSP